MGLLESMLLIIYNCMVLLIHSFLLSRNFLHTFSVTLKIFPQTSSPTSSLLSAVAATLPASLSPSPPIHFLPLTLPPLKKTRCPPPSRTSHSSVYKGVCRDRFSSERVYFGILRATEADASSHWTCVEAQVTERCSCVSLGHVRECCQDWLCCCSSASTCVCRGSRGHR